MHTKPLETMPRHKKTQVRDWRSIHVTLAVATATPTRSLPRMVLSIYAYSEDEMYVSVYGLGATGLLAEYAVKIYKYHRSVKQEKARHDSILQEMLKHTL